MWHCFPKFVKSQNMREEIRCHMGYIGEAAHSIPATGRGALATPGCSPPDRKLKDCSLGALIGPRHTGVEACLLDSPVVRTWKCAAV